MKLKLLSLLLLIGFIACEPTTVELVPGYDAKTYTKGSGEKVEAGKYVYFDLDIIDSKGELMQTMRTMDSKPAIYIPTEEEDIPFNPITSLLAASSIGDSAAVFIPVDSIPEPRSFAGDNPFIEYRIKLIEMTDKASYEAKIKADEEKMMAEAAVMQKLETEKVEGGQSILKDYLSGKSKSSVKSLDNGLKYQLLKEGNGPKAEVGQSLTVTYVGMLKDGTMFDNSFRSGRNFTFQIGKGQVIEGWDTGMAQIPLGGSALLDIPPSIGYGERGSPPVIPPNSDLYFIVEVIDIK